jgi:hypothetical protein
MIKKKKKKGLHALVVLSFRIRKTIFCSERSETQKGI